MRGAPGLQVGLARRVRFPPATPDRENAVNYWKGLALAALFDAAWLMGCPATTTGPDPLPPQEVVAEWPQPDVPALDELRDVGVQEDSLMGYLQEHPDDVSAMERLAEIYVEHEFYDAAIAPLARALQIAPERRSLWSALDRVLELGGRAKITDAELVRRAQGFVESLEMWGHGC